MLDGRSVPTAAAAAKDGAGAVVVRRSGIPSAVRIVDVVAAEVLKKDLRLG